MNKAYTAGGLVLKKYRKNVLLLLIKHKGGFLAFPKGHIESEETEEQAALREVEEETGLQGLRKVRQLGTVVRESEEYSGEIVEETIHLFLLATDDYKHHLAEENYGWFTYEEALEGLGFKEEKQFLKDHWQDLETR